MLMVTPVQFFLKFCFISSVTKLKENEVIPNSSMRHYAIELPKEMSSIELVTMSQETIDPMDEVLQLEIKNDIRTRQRRLGLFYLTLTWIFVALYCLGMIFLCLIFGMQFDLNGKGGNVSSRWLTGCFTSTALDVFVSAPLNACFALILMIYFSREAISGVSFENDPRLRDRVITSIEADLYLLY